MALPQLPGLQAAEVGSLHAKPGRYRPRILAHGVMTATSEGGIRAFAELLFLSSLVSVLSAICSIAS
jgi:hypothetical protein